jgi:pantoate--beta-alanine ligase
MKIIHTVEEMRAACRAARRPLGLVPTMGALHQGHLSLVRMARARCEAVSASIFVNPTQFGPNEDFAKYPRSFERDRQMLEDEGVDLLFAPSVAEMYPEGISITTVTVNGMSERLCGRSRPGHFQGVTTVVAKLFHVCVPDLAFFGQKDAAQVAIIRRMVRDLDFPLGIVPCPIVREPDGLAMSSRNSYLSPQQRKDSLALSRSLTEMNRRFEDGERSVQKLIAAGAKAFGEAARLDYLEIVDPDSLEAIDKFDRPVLAAVAAFVGNVRLIDNILLPAG